MTVRVASIAIVRAVGCAFAAAGVDSCAAAVVTALPAVEETGVSSGEKRPVIGRVLTELPASASNINDFATPVAWHDGEVYTVNVEPPDGASTGFNLRTVVRKGSRNESGAWQWSAHLIEPHTLDDPWHTTASIAVDRRGYVHVAYNMHNMPWQYAVSERPQDISRFVFRGDVLTEAQLLAVKSRNETLFPTQGAAAIPGNQVTYPAFFQDRRGELFVTYRFATRPKRAYRDRAYAAGIAAYDVETRRWNPIGWPVEVGGGDTEPAPGQGRATSVAFAVSPGWWPSPPQLWFDQRNGMHVTWLWRRGSAGKDHTRPSYAYSPDGGARFFKSDGSPYTGPITPDTAEVFIHGSRGHEMKFYGFSSLTTDPAGATLLVAVSPLDGPSQFVRRDGTTRQWSDLFPVPQSAHRVASLGDGRIWAVAEGPIILTHPWDPDAGPPREFDDRAAVWRTVFRQTGWCRPRVLPTGDPGSALVYVQSCDGSSVRILSVEAPP
jgi:putative BNR repeat neuraminidase